MAKAQGIEPQLAVLETAVLPLDHALKFDNKKAPTVSDQGCKILSCVCYALKPQLILYTTILLASNQVFFCISLKNHADGVNNPFSVRLLRP